MRIITWNVNGLRAALRKGFLDHVERLAPDVMLLQEVRALPEQLPKPVADPSGWHVRWHPAEKKGYAGTAIWSRRPLDELGRGMERDDADREGRVISARVDGVRLVSIYLPSGSSNEERQAAKEAWMARFAPWAEALLRSGEPVILGGDLNIAHTDSDIHNPSGNKNNSGFLPHERAWFTELLAQGWHDVLREQVGAQKGPYSWWSNRGRARELDRGWRIDYLLASPAVAGRVRGASIHRQGGIEVSDHAPVIVDLA